MPLQRPRQPPKTMRKSDRPQQTLVGHLSELRLHLILSAVLFAVVTVVAFSFSDVLVNDLIAKAGNTRFVYLSPAELFTTYMRIATTAGLLVSLPFFLNRLWVFIRPGLLRKEIRIIRLAVVLGFGLFVLGLLFAYLVVVPMTLQFLARFQTSQIQSAVGFANYFSYVMNLVFAFALVFELPIAVVVLVSLGIFSTSYLKKNRKYVLLMVTVAAAVITPPDVVSQVLLAIPMMLLFEFGILLGALVEKRKQADSDPLHDAV